MCNPGSRSERDHLELEKCILCNCTIVPTKGRFLTNDKSCCIVCYGGRPDHQALMAPNKERAQKTPQQGALA